MSDFISFLHDALIVVILIYIGYIIGSLHTRNVLKKKDKLIVLPLNLSDDAFLALDELQKKVSEKNILRQPTCLKIEREIIVDEQTLARYKVDKFVRTMGSEYFEESKSGNSVYGEIAPEMYEVIIDKIARLVSKRTLKS